jgi:capsular exopolysaccharide synthesis family protein
MEMIERSLNVSLLGVIPSAALPDGRRTTELSSSKRANRPTKHLSIVTPPEAAPAGPDMCNTAFSESMRSLRTALLLSRSAAPPKVILITSAGEGEGKTTISLHLAAALVRNNSSVILVEGDMRRATLSRRLSLPENNGLSTLLSGSEEKAKFRPFSDLPGLAIVPAGPAPPYPAELLGSKRMKELIEKWSREYDFVLLDSPSLLAVTDAAVLSKLADITLLLTRHARSTRTSLERAWQTLRIDPETKVGVVLNAVKRESAAYAEYFGYYGNSYYGKGERGVHA